MSDNLLTRLNPTRPRGSDQEPFKNSRVEWDRVRKCLKSHGMGHGDLTGGVTGRVTGRVGLSRVRRLSGITGPIRPVKKKTDYNYV